MCAGGTGRQTLHVTLPSVAENKTAVSFGADYTRDSLEGLDHIYMYRPSVCQCISPIIGSGGKGEFPDESQPSSETR